MSLYNLTITVLADNSSGGRGLLAEHGLSLWIEAGGNTILFDTGQGMVLGHNAQRLGISLASAKSIVLSHGHYDHTGGLADVLDGNDKTRLFAHPKTFEPKYARNRDGSSREIGMPESAKKAVESRAEVCLTETPSEISKGVWCTGPIPRTNNYEDTGGAFFKDKMCQEPDPIQDDQALFAETNRGIVVILGCAHAGVINTLNHIRELREKTPIRAVIGGMHLLHANPARMQKTVKEICRLNIQRLSPCHCTGFAAMARLWNEFPKQYETITVGSMIQFED